MAENLMLLTHETLANVANDHPRLHVKTVDKLLGYKIPKVEVKLLQRYRAYDRDNDDSNRKHHYKGNQTWIGLHPQALQKSYCDIGAGYGRVGLVLSLLFPEAKFIGYEIVKQRQLEGSRFFDYLMKHKFKHI